MKTKTPWMWEGKPLEEANGKFGFIYLVTCTHPDEPKKYIGRKFFYVNFGKIRSQKDSNWRYYTTSSKYVNDAIRVYGMEYFKFEVIMLCDTRAGCVSGEVELQWAAKVLHAKNEDGVPIYWNRAIGNIKFVAAEEVSEETRRKLSEANRKRKHSDETKERIGYASRRRSPEANSKVGEANRKRIISEVTRAKLRKAASNRSEETRKKMSESAKNRNKNV